MYDVAVVGGGPAGGSAAVFLAKAGLKTLVLDNDKGQTRRGRIENQYGLDEGIGGPDLVDAGQRQARKLGAEWVTAQVVKIDRFPRVLKVDFDGRTSEPGVWAAGIIAGMSAHTIITAGHGAQVAVGLISEVQGKRHMQHDVMK